MEALSRGPLRCDFIVINLSLSERVMMVVCGRMLYIPTPMGKGCFCMYIGVQFRSVCKTYIINMNYLINNIFDVCLSIVFFIVRNVVIIFIKAIVKKQSKSM